MTHYAKANTIVPLRLMNFITFGDEFLRCLFKMIGPFVVHILFGWSSDGDRIPLVFKKKNFVKLCVNVIIYSLVSKTSGIITFNCD